MEICREATQELKSTSRGEKNSMDDRGRAAFQRRVNPALFETRAWKARSSTAPHEHG
jgi:hypothetical protein